MVSNMGLFTKRDEDSNFSEASKTYSFDSFPTSVTEFKALPEAALKNPYDVAALTILALYAYSKNTEAGCEFLNYLKGPQVLSEREKLFLKDRFDGTSLLPLSYFEGALPDNDYTPKTPYTLAVSENKYSRDQFADGYITLYVKSGGADSPRPITLRNKPSTGQWFLWEFSAVVSGIRTAVGADPWA